MFGRQKSAETRVRVGEHKKVLIGFCVAFSLYTLALLLVFGWLVLNSFKTLTAYRNSIYSLALPFMKSFTLKNYVSVWNEAGTTVSFAEMFQNSLIVCLVMPSVGCFITSFVAYALAKYEFKLNKTFYFVHILTIMFCLAGTQAETYTLLANINLVETLWGLIVMGCGASGMNFLLLYGTYKSISGTYMEAAEIDGAGDFRIYFHIMLPQAMGIIGTLWMFSFINTWNDYATINLFLSSKPTIAVGLETLRVAYIEEDIQYPKYYAALVFSLLPVVILFLCFQEQIMKLSLGGGIKG